MKYEIFSAQIARLSSVFGERNYSSERIKMLWGITCNADETAFVRWVDFKIADSKTAPLGEEFRLFASKNKKNKFISDNISEIIFCQKCDGTGSVIAQKKDDHTKWIFLCSCPAGEKSHWAQNKKTPSDAVSWKIPNWLNQNQSLFEVV